uniref:CRAL-TRIO domain-containing protein n=1 Tax=Ananas comosus var. bracteatus TaxID=296719 RepID=A0A6V7QG36_ANACO|nr:unnamed protein product [Ananas comosus var. bracteatus]
MAEETLTKEHEAAEEEKKVTENEQTPPPPPPAPEAEDEPKKPVAVAVAGAAPDAAEAAKVGDLKAPTAATTISQVVSFKEEEEETSAADPEKKALDELKRLLRSALANRDFPCPPPPPPPPPSAAEDEAAAEEDGAKTVEAIAESVVPAPAPTTPPRPEEVSIWGVPLFADERTDTVLLKFLRARDLHVESAMAMLTGAVAWRRSFAIDALLAEDLAGASELSRAVFMNGADREGHPVCYNLYGELQRKELYAAAFADEEKRRGFLKWRIQFLEKGIRELLDFKPGGVSTMVQVTDLSNSAVGPVKRDLRNALALLLDNYPEFVAKQIFINVPWWYLAFNRMISPFLTQRTKSKFVFAGPSKSAETLFKHIAPEQVPVRFGGLSKENDADFTTTDAVTEIALKPSTNQDIVIPTNETSVVVWELRVLGWDVTYGAEYVPSREDAYTVIVQKARKMCGGDEPVVKDCFKIREPGKIVITVDNTTTKRKKLLYRYKTKKEVSA